MKTDKQTLSHRLRLGKELRLARTARSLSIEDVANITDLKPVTIRNVEAGKFSADIDLISKIATVYECEIDVCDERGYNYHPMFNEDIKF